jgi:putative mRNA 3-end processing factor
MLIMTKKGLYCEAGNFYIDPSGAVDHAVVTHAHADHARKGSRQYYCVTSGVSLLKARLGPKIAVRSHHYGEVFHFNDVKVSFYPAGHILGSCQVRLERAGQVWVASGDYKREPDPTCEPFEVVPCDVFVTEATFGTPGFSWPQNSNVGEEIHSWWSANAARGINSVLFAYSLGKAQRILGELHKLTNKCIYCHPAATVLNDCYRAHGVPLAPTYCLSKLEPSRVLRGELFLVPQSFLKTDQAEVLGRHYQTAFASGWMAQSRYGGYDRGFLMSDHADWKDLLRTIQETRAKRVYVQHRGNGALVKHLRTLGIEAFPDTELVPKPMTQLSFF